MRSASQYHVGAAIPTTSTRAHVRDAGTDTLQKPIMLIDGAMHGLESRGEALSMQAWHNGCNCVQRQTTAQCNAAQAVRAQRLAKQETLA